MADKGTRKSSGHGGLILGLLGILFVGLKLTGVVNWSWWLVLAPFWGPAVLAVVIVVIALIVMIAFGSKGD